MPFPVSDKLRVVVRRDLPAGAQAVQGMHALRLFAAEHPAWDNRWYCESQTLALLETEDERSLTALMERAGRAGIAVAGFHEPDLSDALTAVAVEPSKRGKRLCRGLRPALQQQEEPMRT